jgi:NADH dehydrogenase
MINFVLDKISMNIPESKLPRIVIIGGGFAGVSMAKMLANKPVQVVLIDKHNYHTFQPLLYQVSTAGLEPDSIAYPLRKIIKKHRTSFFRLAEVERIDSSNYVVETNI